MLTFKTPLIQIPRPANADEIRRAWVANARSLVDESSFGSKATPHPGVGLEAGNPTTRAAFEELLGPGRWALDVPFAKWRQGGKVRTRGISTCAMVALGLGRRMRVDCEDWLDGYADDIGSGLNVAIDFARGLLPRGAWQTPVDGLRPGPGDVVQVVKPMHAAVVIRWDDDGQLVTADGGQVGRRGLQACAMRRRRWVADSAGAKLGSRRVDGWIMVDLLGYRDEPVTVPVGWAD